MRLASLKQKGLKLVHFGKFLKYMFCTLNFMASFQHFPHSKWIFVQHRFCSLCPYFTTITHMPMFEFFMCDFRRREHLGPNMEFTLNLHAQANTIQIARPNLLQTSSTFISNWFWATQCPKNCILPQTCLDILPRDIISWYYCPI